MLKLYKYNIAYTFRKASTWAILIILALLLIGIMVGSGIGTIMDTHWNARRANVLLKIQDFITMLLLVPIIISISYTALKASNIFKDGEKDGTTLLIVSKPFTRKEIVFSKILSALTHAFLPAIIFFISFLIGDIIFDSKYMATNIKYILAYTLGILVIDIIFMSISLLLASVLGKVGTSLLTMVSFIIIWVFGIILPTFTHAGKATYYSGYVYNNKTNKFSEGTSVEGYKMNQKDKYKVFSYFDIWYQISGPFNLMSTDSPLKYTSNIKVRTLDEQKKLLDNSTITLKANYMTYDFKSKKKVKGKSKKFIFYVPQNVKIHATKIISSFNIIKSINEDKNIETNVNKTSKAIISYFEKNKIPSVRGGLNFSNSSWGATSYAALYVWFRKHANDKEIKIGYNKKKNMLTGKSKQHAEEFISTEMVLKNYGANLLESFKSLEKVQECPNIYNSMDRIHYMAEHSLISEIDDRGTRWGDMKKQFVYKAEIVPYINPWVRSTIWIIISLLMISGVTIVYMRRDFK